MTSRATSNVKVDLDTRCDLSKPSDRFTYHVIKFILFLLCAIPKPLFFCLCWVSYKLVYIFGTKQKKIIKKNYEFIFTNSSRKNIADGIDPLKTFTEKVVRHQVFSSLESFRQVYKFEQFEFSGVGQYQRCAWECEPNGVAVLAAHIGAWEILSRLVPMHDRRDFYAIGKPNKNKGVNRILDDLRKINGSKMLWTGRTGLKKDMLNALNTGHTIGLVMDQKPRKRMGPTVDFLGKKTPFVSGPAVMTMQSNGIACAVSCIREGFMSYRIISSIIKHEKEDDIVTRTQAYAKEIERQILLFPEQWCWNYKRWNYKEESSH
jgi:lauroyl/myristoyl acyltransferase